MKTKDYKKFRSVFIIIVAILLIILRSDIVNTIRTPFSGTTYLPLPSNYYTTKMIIADRIISDASGNETIKNDTIFPGSFILLINDELFKTDYNGKDSSLAMSTFYKSIKKNSKNITLQIVNSSRPSYADELVNGNYFLNYSEKYVLSNKQVIDSTIKLIFDGIYLGFIDKNGATNRAGIKTGDILLSVNKIVWKVKYYPDLNTFQLDTKSINLLRSQPIGEPLYYKVLRTNHEKVFKVYLASFGIQLQFLFSAILGIAFCFMGIYFIFLKKGDYGTLLTGLYILLLGFYIASSSSLKPLELDFILKLKFLLTDISPMIA